MMEVELVRFHLGGDRLFN